MARTRLNRTTRERLPPGKTLDVVIAIDRVVLEEELDVTRGGTAYGLATIETPDDNEVPCFIPCSVIERVGRLLKVDDYYFARVVLNPRKGSFAPWMVVSINVSREVTDEDDVVCELP